ncbi:MAG: hypothetical protein PUD59_02140 [bacterium]|nr:hypothetical protein [bacterium]
MALLTDKETEKDLNERLDEFLQFGMIFNYMIDIEIIDEEDIKKMLFSSDREQATIIYSKILKKMKENYSEKAYLIYSREYPNLKELDIELYKNYLNICCMKKIISKIQDKKIDKTYLNTYNYLLSNNANIVVESR